MMKKILVVGAGYVGMSYACLLSSRYDVKIDEIDDSKKKLIERKKSFFKDPLIETTLKKNKQNISLYDCSDELNDFDFIFLCLPTNYDAKTNNFDLRLYESKVEELSKENFRNVVVIKSTVPVGYTDSLSKKYKDLNIIFSPEFLREGSPLKDAMQPDRTIAGGDNESCQSYIKLLKKCIANKSPYILMESSEAEAVKLFSNTYLAMRISFFNELDSFSITHNLNTKNLIEGVCADKRIGNFYNNPSFGYGGYCLPKDTKQLLSNYKGIPQDMITSIVSSNETRKQFIASEVIKKAKKGVVGIYRLLMKKNADNFRESSILGIIELLQHKGCELLIFEPSYKDESFKGIRVEKDFDAFYKESSLILVNRYDEKVEALSKKVFSRDIFQRD